MNRGEFLKGVMAATALVLSPLQAVAKKEPDPIIEDAIARIGATRVRIRQSPGVWWTIDIDKEARDFTTLDSPMVRGEIGFPLPLGVTRVPQANWGEEFHFLFEREDGIVYEVPRAIIVRAPLRFRYPGIVLDNGGFLVGRGRSTGNFHDVRGTHGCFVEWEAKTAHGSGDQIGPCGEGAI